MIVKDYYKVLNLTPGATSVDVKKAFRGLALQYHPDRTKDNPFALAWYREIQEAYNTLADDVKREAYHEQCWYLRSIGKKPVTVQPLIPETICKQFQNLQRQVYEMDHFRMDQQQVSTQCVQLLNPENIDILQKFKQSDYDSVIVNAIMEIMQPLHYKYCLPIVNAAGYFADTYKQDRLQFEKLLKQKKLDAFWGKYQAWVWLFITIAACAVIYFVNKR
ncbi:J domain-containing protein [Polluticaenibacter yanchengensis]|uniref:DnaJ domain-containing protein n=1 Tax=Polluticaenibacter yanchengensis TaxID=3014562 RepID=A0ABT4UP21_9BACT|nr:DnaJ domain-containing protein [Chitinophagaceae bacterium LY-5]